MVPTTEGQGPLQFQQHGLKLVLSWLTVPTTYGVDDIERGTPPLPTLKGLALPPALLLRGHNIAPGDVDVELSWHQH